MVTCFVCEMLVVTWCSLTMLQVVPRSDKDNVLEASLASTHQQAHARFCTTLGDGDDRYDPLTRSFRVSQQSTHNAGRIWTFPKPNCNMLAAVSLCVRQLQCSYT